MADFKPINSSNLKAASYDAATREMVVQFRNATSYSYLDIDADLWSRFEATFDGEGGASAGKFFHQHIRNLPCEKL